MTPLGHEHHLDLYVFGLRGRLPIFIFMFFKDRYFNVRVGSNFSDTHPQEMGVPQGSILSVPLFSVKINNITQCDGRMCYYLPPVNRHAYVCIFKVPNPQKVVNATGQLEKLARSVLFFVCFSSVRTVERFHRIWTLSTERIIIVQAGLW